MKFRNIPGNCLTTEKKTCIPSPLYPETMMTAVEACRRTIGSCAAGTVTGGSARSRSSRRRMLSWAPR